MNDFSLSILIIGMICAVFSAIYFSPQFYKIIKTKKTSDISYLFLALGIVASFLWIIFAILIFVKGIEEKTELWYIGLPIIVGQFFILLMNVPMLIIKYKNVKNAKLKNMSESDYCMIQFENKNSKRK